ncbi:hypothetical protein [Pseudodesulfovibrio sp. zrk46]|uniref:hypothetical protein n=1 Tax=Pseudodesulfovibrio sp. zrk46 TaxID=2725288 RepID=UPI00144A215C|nr:hypothetical protein [Pseudodesulfovibrio sp. zrk46]QJB57348.1 hypothetical protein HFN16_13445 [Pseudodesulfovibrio sp. zrk46]
MLIELYFVLGVLAVAMIALATTIETYIAQRWFRKDSMPTKAFTAFEKRYPHLSDPDNQFYCFFTRDSFRTN